MFVLSRESNRFVRCDARTEIIVQWFSRNDKPVSPSSPLWVRQEFVKITVLVAARVRNYYRALRTPLYLTNVSPFTRYGRAAFPLAKHDGRGM